MVLKRRAYESTHTCYAVSFGFSTSSIRHFLVARFKARLSAKPLIWKSANRTHYHKKVFALSLVLKVKAVNEECANDGRCGSILTHVQYTQTDTIRQSDGPLLPMVRLVPIQSDVIPVVLLVNMHFIRGLRLFSHVTWLGTGQLPMDHWNCSLPSQATWENNLKSP